MLNLDEEEFKKKTRENFINWLDDIESIEREAIVRKSEAKKELIN